MYHDVGMCVSEYQRDGRGNGDLVRSIVLYHRGNEKKPRHRRSVFFMISMQTSEIITI